MKRTVGFLNALSTFCAVSFGQSYDSGIVYGPKAAFTLTAPEGWVLDNRSGKSQGLPCVLYRKGQSWADGKTVMYAKVASTDFEDADVFVSCAINEMKETHGVPKVKIAIGKTKDGHDYFINEYPATKTYSQWERVAYVQLPHAVGYIVLTSRDKANYQKDCGVLEAMVKNSFTYVEAKIDPAN